MKKKFCIFALVLLCCSVLFSQTYEEYLAKAKQYESEKRWCYALGAYYDAMGTDIEPELKQEAYDGYIALRDVILSGQPGYGTFNVFTLYDEWKNLLIDAEKFGCSFNPYQITVGDLKLDKLNYETRTATYCADISYKYNSRYEHTINIIQEGLKNAKYKHYDWTDFPYQWPLYSVSYKKDGVYNVNGVYVFAYENSYINAFAVSDLSSNVDISLIDCRFNIVDEDGKELVKPKRCLLERENKIVFDGISAEIMELIDNGKAFVNPVGSFLQYGKYVKSDDKGGRTFIKNFPEVQIPVEKSVFICWNNEVDKSFLNVTNMKLRNIDSLEMVPILEKNIEVSKIELTQKVYEIVMGFNPSERKNRDDENKPVDSVTWYDAVYFCNLLSMINGLEPVYAVNDVNNIFKWDYRNGIIYSTEVFFKDSYGELYPREVTNTDISQNSMANGFRLPTVEEWQYAAKGGENYKYAGSDDVDEVVSFYEAYTAPFQFEPTKFTSSVAQKKPNGFGLYDMSGNVAEWCWDTNFDEVYNENYKHTRALCGGSSLGSKEYCTVNSISYSEPYANYKAYGFRIVRTITE